MKLLIAMFFLICLLSCGGSQGEEVSIIYYHSYIDSGIWIGTHEIDLTALKANEALSSLVSISFDEITRLLWAYSFSKDSKHIFFFNITNGTVDIDNGVPVERPEKLYLCKNINNDKILYSTDGRNYIIIDLYTQIRKEFIINDIDGRIPMGFPQDPIGFSDNYVIFRNGYYNISEYEYVFFNDLRYPRFIADKNKIIGLNSLNDIVIYDLTTKSKNKTSIKREIKKGVKYNGNDLYFLENDDLFVSKDMNGFSNIIRMFLPPSFTKREWYKYDLNTGKRSKIFSPDDMVVILGKF